MKQNIIAVDFDGTLCENKWPEIGMPNEELIEYLKKRQANGEKLILWTSRNEEQTKEAVDVRRHIVGGANRTLFSVDLPPRLCRTGT